MDALRLLNTAEQEQLYDFKAYLEHSLREPFTMNLKDCSLMEVIYVCIKSNLVLLPAPPVQSRSGVQSILPFRQVSNMLS